MGEWTPVSPELAPITERLADIADAIREHTAVLTGALSQENARLKALLDESIRANNALAAACLSAPAPTYVCNKCGYCGPYEHHTRKDGFSCNYIALRVSAPAPKEPSDV